MDEPLNENEALCGKSPSTDRLGAAMQELLFLVVDRKTGHEYKIFTNGRILPIRLIANAAAFWIFSLPKWATSHVCQKK